MSKSFISC